MLITALLGGKAEAWAQSEYYVCDDAKEREWSTINNSGDYVIDGPAKTLTFEQNSDLLWIHFKSKIIQTLDQMVSGSGISGYEIKKQKTTITLITL